MNRTWTEPTWEDIVANVAVEAITVLAFAWFGALMGSFLNVVVYRLPRGMNLLWPPSACPDCGTRLSWRENLPIFGYLRLRGKCKHCGARIDLRYVLAEIMSALATIFLLVTFVRTGGSNLPYREPEFYKGFLYTLWYPKFGLLSITFWFLVLFFLSFCYQAWSRRGQTAPLSFRILACACGLLPPFLFPWLIQVPLYGMNAEGKWPGLESGWDALVCALAGFLLGWFVGFAHLVAVRFQVVTANSTTNLSWFLAVWGAMTGWQTLVIIATVSFLILLLWPTRLDPISVIWVVGGLILAAWKPVVGNLSFLFAPNPVWGLVLMVFCLALGALTAWRPRTEWGASAQPTTHTEKP